MALAQHRLGVDAARLFQLDVCLVLEVAWVDAAAQQAGVAAVLAAGRRHLSLVDCVSFGTMRQLGLRHAFTLDAHFGEQGFVCLPAEQPNAV